MSDKSRLMGDSPDESNPLLEALPALLRFKDLPGALVRRPLASEDWRSHQPADRERWLDLSQDHFAPTAPVIDAAAGIQRLMRRSLTLRNPLSVDEQKRVNTVGLIERKTDLSGIPRLDGAGSIITGITGMGKTALIRRTLDCIAPQQVIDYGTAPSCGWYKMRQCVYLHLDHPSNGSRGALLKRMLERLDNALGTDYSSQHHRTVNIDMLLVVVAKLLTLHRVAVVIVDENQEATFEESPWRTEFLLFYHTLMNLGISVVLAGNPLAFQTLRQSSQVMNRFSTGGIHRLAPASEQTEYWWEQHFLPQAREFSVVEAWNVDLPRRNEIEFENSAGVPGLLSAYLCEVQRMALRRCSDVAVVTEEDYFAAMKSPSFFELRQIAIAIRTPQTSSSHRYLDLPPEHSVMDTRESVSVLPLNLGNHNTNTEPLMKLVANYQRESSRKFNNLKKKLESFQHLGPEDVRMMGVTQELLSEMAQQINTGEKQGTTPKLKGRKGHKGA